MQITVDGCVVVLEHLVLQNTGGDQALAARLYVSHVSHSLMQVGDALHAHIKLSAGMGTVLCSLWLTDCCEVGGSEICCFKGFFCVSLP